MGVMILPVAYDENMSQRMTKTYKMTCAPSEDLDQPRRPPSLIGVLGVCMKKNLDPKLPIKRTAKTLIRLGGCPG